MIVPVQVIRDDQGYWTHPALLEYGCTSSADFISWLYLQRLECEVMTMRDEAPEAFSAGWHDGPPDAFTWRLAPPPGEGWFLGSVHPREGGPECYWLRHIRRGKP